MCWILFGIQGIQFVEATVPEATVSEATFLEATESKSFFRLTELPPLTCLLIIEE